MRYAELKGIKLYSFVDDCDEDGNLNLRKQRPATDADIKKAFGVHYCTTPEYSDNSYWSSRDMERDDPVLVQVVEELGDEADGSCASLEIEDIPTGSRWRIDEYDGHERVMTQNSYDWKIAG